MLELLLLTAIAFSAFSCSDNSNAKDDRAEPPPTAIPVILQTVETGNVADVISATGTIFPLHDVVVSSETAGTVKQVFIQVGDYVEHGERLVQVDAELKELAVVQAQAVLQQARATFDKMNRDHERNQKLFASKDISENVYEGARLQKESAEAAFLSAQASLKMAQRQLRDTGIRSPVSGLVAARMVELGTTVAPGMPVAKVVDISQVRIRFGVTEREVVKLAQRQAATVTVASFAQREFGGSVSSVGPQADLSTRTFPIEVLVDNPDGKLKAGMVANVSVQAAVLHSVPLLPKSALLQRAGETFVFVARSNSAEKRAVVVGFERGENVAVTDGLRAGERVVVLGQENLTHGAAIQVQTGNQF